MAGTTRAIGIDFGTSTSMSAEGDALRGTTLAPLGRTTTYMPTVLGVTETAMLAGDPATDLPERQIIRSIKRQITDRGEVLPHPLSADRHIDVDDGIIEVLRTLASTTRGYFELDADTIRLGCPSMWDADQRTRLLKLAQKAGIPVADHTLIDEPIAAGMAWISHRVREFGDRIRGRLLVFDMGGGTLDVALLQIDTTSGDHSGEISVLSSKGVNGAGDKLDLSIRDDILEMVDDLGTELTAADWTELDQQALLEARQVKVLLSSQDHALIRMQLPAIRLPILTYTREQLEAAFASQLDAAESLTWHVVRESYLTHEVHRPPAELRAIPDAVVAKGVAHVLLAGGMSQIPAVRDRLEKMFPHAAIHARIGPRIAPDEAIVAGLAETTAFDRVNLHRPPFDFLLALPDGSTVTLYRAHSPLYEGWRAWQQSDLYYEKVVSAKTLPVSSSATLIARSSMGRDVAFRFGNNDRAGIHIPLGRDDIRFRIRPNGVISLTDGKGRHHAFRVNRWPVLRGKDHAAIQLERLTSRTTPPEEHLWQKDPLFLH